MSTKRGSAKVFDLLFIPIQKVDEENRLVYGEVASEVPDNSGETFDYDGSKPFFEKWSDNAYNTSGGKSYGNIRVMHTSKAAGIVQQPLGFDDVNKVISACAEVVDDDEWKKVLKGVYTGFSMGGRYVERIKKGDQKRYIADPVEISLVDKPCIPSATFDVVKADGVVEHVEFLVKGTPADDNSPGAAKRADEPDATNRREDTGKFRNKTETEQHGGSDPTGHGASEATATTKSDAGDLQMRIPTNDEVLPHAQALAKAAGRDNDWLEYMVEASEKMQKGEYGGAWAEATTAPHVIVDPKAKIEGVDIHDDDEDPNKTRATGADGAPASTSGAATSATGKNKDDTEGAGARKGDMPEAIKDKIDAKKDGDDKDNKDDKDAKKADGPESHGDDCKCVKCMPEENAEKADSLRQLWTTSDGRGYVKKADAVEHEEALAKADPPETLTSLLKAATVLVEDLGKADDGDTEYADPANSKYPIDNEKHIRAAWSYINMPKNQKGYTSAEVSSVKGKIVAAWKDKIDKDGPPSAASKADVAEFGKAVQVDIDRLQKFVDDDLIKGMYTVSRLADLLQCLEGIACSVAWEEQAEGDASPLPEMIFGNLKSLGASLVAMADEEVKEMIAMRGKDLNVGPTDEIILLAAGTLGLEKADLDTDLQKRMGTVRPTGDVVSKADFDAVVEKAAKLESEVAEALPLVKSLMADVERIKATPMPMRRPGTVVEKTDGAPGGSGGSENLLEKYTADQLTDAALRLGLANGRPFVPQHSVGR